MSQPNPPIVNLGNLYVQGCQLFYSSATTFFVASGQARNSNNVNDIVIPSLLDINTGYSGPGGLDQGTLQANTLYAVYVIGLSGSSNYAAIISKSFGFPILNGQYNMFRRVGCVATDSSKNIIQFFQTGTGTDRYMWYDTFVQVVNAGGTSSYQPIDCSSLVPQSVNGCMTLLSAVFGASLGLASGLFLRPTGSSSNLGYTQATADFGNLNYFSTSCPASSSASIDYSVTTVSGVVSIYVAGYIDCL